MHRWDRAWRSRQVGRLRWSWRRITVRQLRRAPYCTSIGRRVRIVITPGGSLTVGRGIVLDEGVSLHVQGHLVLGDRLYLGRDSRIVCFQHVVVGEDVRFAERVSVHDEAHAYEPVPMSDSARHIYNCSPVQIGARVWLATNVVVGAGTVIGDDTVVAAGSVVTKDLPAGVLAGGAPAGLLRTLRPG